MAINKNLVKYIGKRVCQKSGNFFPAGEKTKTVESITINPHTNNFAFTFTDIPLLIDCDRCELVNKNSTTNKFKKRKRHIIIKPKMSIIEDDISDYDIQITQDIRSTQEWSQLVVMKYGSLANWHSDVVDTTAAILHDSGDGILIDVNEKKLTLDYSEFSQLIALLLYYQTESKLDQNELLYVFNKTVKRKQI